MPSFSTNVTGSHTNNYITLPKPLTILYKEIVADSSKSNSNEIETFISLVEKDIFKDTSRKRISSNLSGDEKKTLGDCREMYAFTRQEE